MHKSIIAAGSIVLGLNVAADSLAQEQSPGAVNEARYVELQQARSDMLTARRQLEQAARTIAAQARTFPGSDDFSFDFNFDGLDFAGFGGPGRIGVSIVDADDGALVTRVVPNSGAAEAGIRVGDVIRSVGGVDVTAADDNPISVVVAQLREVEPGSAVAVVVERAGDSLEFDVEISDGGNWPGFLVSGDGDARVFSVPGGPGLGEFRMRNGGPGSAYRGIVRALGFASSPWGEMELVSLTEGLGRYFETSEGLLVVSGPEDEAIGIEDGDVILAISGRVPNSPEHAIRILSSFEAGETIEFSIMRDGRRETIEYTMPDSAGFSDLPVPVTD